MPSNTTRKPWRFADVTFIEIEITHRTDTQLRVEFDCGLRNRLKILYYDRTGVCVLSKRLETGTFSWPAPSSPGTASLSLAPESLQLLRDGIDLRGAQMRPWCERRE